MALSERPSSVPTAESPPPLSALGVPRPAAVSKPRAGLSWKGLGLAIAAVCLPLRLVLSRPAVVRDRHVRTVGVSLLRQVCERLQMSLLSFFDLSPVRSK